MDELVHVSDDQRSRGTGPSIKTAHPPSPIPHLSSNLLALLPTTNRLRPQDCRTFTMRQTRSQAIAESFKARRRLRSDMPLAISKSKSRRQAPRVRRRLPSATAIAQDATENPIPRSPSHGLGQAADPPILDEPATADSAAGQAPDLAREVSAGPTCEGGNLLLEHDLAETASAGLVMEEAAASGPGVPAELANEDGAPAREGTFDSVEPVPDSVEPVPDSVMEEASRWPPLSFSSTRYLAKPHRNRGF